MVIQAKSSATPGRATLDAMYREHQETGIAGTDRRWLVVEDLLRRYVSKIARSALNGLSGSSDFEHIVEDAHSRVFMAFHDKKIVAAEGSFVRAAGVTAWNAVVDAARQRSSIALPETDHACWSVVRADARTEQASCEQNRVSRIFEALAEGTSTFRFPEHRWLVAVVVGYILERHQSPSLDEFAAIGGDSDHEVTAVFNAALVRANRVIMEAAHAP